MYNSWCGGEIFSVLAISFLSLALKLLPMEAQTLSICLSFLFLLSKKLEDLHKVYFCIIYRYCTGTGSTGMYREVYEVISSGVQSTTDRN